MINLIARRLLLVNTLVFVFVLALFSGVVYTSITHDFELSEQRRLNTLIDTVISSFHSPKINDNDADDDDIPDIFDTKDDVKEVDVLSDRASLQWFDQNEKLLYTKGSIPITMPLALRQFQEQQSPHAMVETRAVRHKDRMVGYLRAAISLSDFDAFRKRLLTGLISGISVALVAVSIGVFWLMRQSLRPVQTMMNKLSQFTADASHELRNPLMAIKTNAAVALRHEEGIRDRDREKFEAILDAVNQMIRTTSNLLILAQVEQHEDWGDAASFNLSKVILQLLAHLQPKVDAKAITLTQSIAPDLYMMAKPDDMKSLIGNLLDNAIQYSDHGGHVTINASKQGKRVVVEVRDDGIGINEDDLTKVFNRFWRSDKARTHNSGGSGLGLALVQAILNRYGGSIVIDSKIGSGTVVTITLPVVQRALLQQGAGIS